MLSRLGNAHMTLTSTKNDPQFSPPFFKVVLFLEDLENLEKWKSAKSVEKHLGKKFQKFVIFVALCCELPVLPVFSLKCLKGHGCVFCGHQPSGWCLWLQVPCRSLRVSNH